MVHPAAVTPKALAAAAAERAAHARELTAARAETRNLGKEAERLRSLVAQRDAQAVDLARESSEHRKAAERSSRTAEALQQQVNGAGGLSVERGG